MANIYQSLDEISQESYISHHGIAAEDYAMKHCDIATGTSSKLCQRNTESSGKKVHLMANAADYDTFANAINRDFEKPIELLPFTEPVII